MAADATGGQSNPRGHHRCGGRWSSWAVGPWLVGFYRTEIVDIMYIHRERERERFWLMHTCALHTRMYDIYIYIYAVYTSIIVWSDWRFDGELQLIDWRWDSLRSPNRWKGDWKGEAWGKESGSERPWACSVSKCFAYLAILTRSLWSLQIIATVPVSNEMNMVKRFGAATCEFGCQKLSKIT